MFCLLTMNHHPLHINDVYASQSQQGQNVVVGPLVYSIMLGMSVADVSGKAIANLATEELSHPAPGLPRRHAVRRERGARGDAVALQARPRRREGQDRRLQAGRHAGRDVQARGARAAPQPRRVARCWALASTPRPVVRLPPGGARPRRLGNSGRGETGPDERAQGPNWSGEGQPVAAEISERIRSILADAEGAADALRHQAEQDAQARRRAAETEALDHRGRAPRGRALPGRADRARIRAERRDPRARPERRRAAGRGRAACAPSSPGWSRALGETAARLANEVRAMPGPQAPDARARVGARASGPSRTRRPPGPSCREPEPEPSPEAVAEAEPEPERSDAGGCPSRTARRRRRSRARAARAEGRSGGRTSSAAEPDPEPEAERADSSPPPRPRPPSRRPRSVELIEQRPRRRARARGRRRGRRRDGEEPAARGREPLTRTATEPVAEETEAGRELVEVGAPESDRSRRRAAPARPARSARGSWRFRWPSRAATAARSRRTCAARSTSTSPTRSWTTSSAPGTDAGQARRLARSGLSHATPRIKGRRPGGRLDSPTV